MSFFQDPPRDGRKIFFIHLDFLDVFISKTIDTKIERDREGTKREKNAKPPFYHIQKYIVQEQCYVPGSRCVNRGVASRRIHG